jgi:hypothetical protein
MKKIAYIVSALALVSAAPAFAAPTIAVGDINVSGSVTPQCKITNPTGTPTVSIVGDLADPSGFARTDIGTAVAVALGGANVTAWCSGNTNTVVVSRTAFVKTGGAPGGVVDGSGFANGAVYDVAVTIPGGIRSNTSSDVDVDGTSDGAGNGPGIGTGAGLSVDSFGPTGTGVVLTFANEGSSTSGAITADGADGDTTTFAVNNSNRLSAGSYTSTVTLTLSPAV